MPILDKRGAYAQGKPMIDTTDTFLLQRARRASGWPSSVIVIVFEHKVSGRPFFSIL
jgi:hypothetical protein